MPVIIHMENGDAYLVHYGVPGMKWGVRKLIERSDRRVSRAQQLVSDRQARYNRRPNSRFRQFQLKRAKKALMSRRVTNKMLKGQKRLTPQERKIAKQKAVKAAAGAGIAALATCGLAIGASGAIMAVASNPITLTAITAGSVVGIPAYSVGAEALDFSGYVPPHKAIRG